jgi:hypothetical protein
MGLGQLIIKEHRLYFIYRNDTYRIIEKMTGELRPTLWPSLPEILYIHILACRDKQT